MKKSRWAFHQEYPCGQYASFPEPGKDWEVLKWCRRGAEGMGLRVCPLQPAHGGLGRRWGGDGRAVLTGDFRISLPQAVSVNFPQRPGWSSVNPIRDGLICLLGRLVSAGSPSSLVLEQFNPAHPVKSGTVNVYSKHTAVIRKRQNAENIAMYSLLPHKMINIPVMRSG